MKQNLLLFFFFVTLPFLWSQDFKNTEPGHAILVNNFRTPSQTIKSHHKKFMDIIANTPSINFTIYDWNDETHEILLSDIVPQSEKPSRYIHFVTPDFVYKINPNLIFKTDTSNIVRNVFIEYSVGMSYTVKTVDLATSKVLSIRELTYIPHVTKVLEVKNFKEYYPTNPITLKKRDYDLFLEKQDKMFDDYDDAIRRKQQEIANPIFKENFFNSSVFTKWDDVIYPIENKIYLDIKEKEQVKIPGGFKDGITDFDIFRLYETKQVGKLKYLDEHMILKVNELNEDETMLGPDILAFKKLRKLMEIGTQYYTTRNQRILNEFSYVQVHEPLQIILDKECYKCTYLFEKELSLNPAVQLVVKNLPEMEYFAQLLTKDEFSHFNVSSVNISEVNPAVLVNLKNRTLEAVDLKTGKTFHHQVFVYNTTQDESDRGRSQSAILDIISGYDPDKYYLTWVETTSEKKEKINDAIVYHPAGFSNTQWFEIFTYEKVEENGKTINKKEIIGEVRTTKPLSLQISPIKVLSGKEELYQAVKAGKTLHLATKR